MPCEPKLSLGLSITGKIDFNWPSGNLLWKRRFIQVNSVLVTLANLQKYFGILTLRLQTPGAGPQKTLQSWLFFATAAQSNYCF